MAESECLSSSGEGTSGAEANGIESHATDFTLDIGRDGYGFRASAPDERLWYNGFMSHAAGLPADKEKAPTLTSS